MKTILKIDNFSACRFSYDVDIFGGTGHEYVEGIANGHDCVELCRNHADCQAFIFVPGENGGVCHMKWGEGLYDQQDFVQNLLSGYMHSATMFYCNQ